jgi:UDP-N-acetylmuramoylalanine--D-glutamate ligase
MTEENKSYSIHKSKKSQVDRIMEARESLRKNLESTAHRLERVLEHDGVEYISDTRSTDLLSTRDTFKCTLKPIIWLAGSTAHDRDYSLLEKYIKYKIKSIVVYGPGAEDMSQKLKNLVESISRESNLEAAVKKASEIAKRGDVIIFSPSCLIKDKYEDFAQRGLAFKQIVKQQLGV